MDANGKILFEGVGGVLIDDLRSRGLTFNESQLALLVDYGLIDRDGEVIETQFPVLDPSAIAAVRDRTQAIAHGLLNDVAETVHEVVGKLAVRNQEQSGYALVFGHALDGVVWDLLRARKLLPAIDLTIDAPFWRGSFWACYPGRQGSAGTNEIRENGTTLVLVWNDEMTERLAAFSAEPGLRPLLRAIDPTATEASLVSGTGWNHMVPVIRTAESDPVHAACSELAQVVAVAIADWTGCQDVLADAGVAASAEDAVVIVTHELIWEIADLLTQSGTIVRPSPGAGVAPWIYIKVAN